ncbi:MAG: TVP38/TMEM64 family protein [Candidatus Hinthialibacter antarcticus]|nr:TVP38/TMEM64 family protein [Candidatus Hinthialibacter antarcticus]
MDTNEPTPDVIEKPSQLKKKSIAALIKPIGLLIAVIAATWALKALGVGEWLESARGWIEGLGAWGPVVYVLLYIGATVACLPGTIMTFMGGALFGSVLGTILVSIGSTIGASICFLIARYLARDSIKGWLEGNERFQKLDKLTEKEGDIIVMITRLIPIFPFNVLNYGFGLTRVDFKTYVLWSWLCMLPFTVVYVVGSDAIVQAIQDGTVPWALLFVVAAVLVIMTAIIRKAKKRLAKTGDADSAS